jgi:hypothetical protein
MTLQKLLETSSPHRQVPSKTDTAKVAQLLAANKKRADAILLSIKLSLPTQVDSVEKVKTEK